MPNTKRSRRARRPPRRSEKGFASWFASTLREAALYFPPVPMPPTRSVRHLRNAAIEFLEAMRVVLGETIEWLKHEGRLPAELKRIRVEE